MVSGITGGFDLSTMVQSIFKKTDTSGDGSIDKTELQSLLQNSQNVDVNQLFSNLDTDSDGKISTGEVKSALQKIGEGMQARMGEMKPPDPSEMFNHLDTNGDGSISEDELAAGSPDGNGPGGVSISDFLQSQDTDGDGKISKTEFEAGVKSMESNRPAGGPPPGGMGGASSSDSGSDSNKVYSKEDTNKDGVVSPLETMLYALKQTGASSKKSDVTALLDALKSSQDEEDDGIKALFEKLAENLQNSVNYNQQGTVGISVNASTFSITA